MEANEKNRLQERNAVRTLLFALLIGAAGGVIRGIQLLDFNERNFPSASGGNRGITVSNLSASYYSRHYLTARRIPM